MKVKMGWWVAALALAAVLAACGGPEARRASYYAKGKALYEKGDYVKAGLELKNAIQVDPKYAPAYALLGLSQLKRGEPQQAFGTLSKAVGLDAGLLDAQAALARLFLLGGDLKRAREKADQVLAKTPGQLEARVVKAACLAKEGHLGPSAEVLEGALAQNPAAEEAALLLAEVRQKDGKAAEARAVLESFLARRAENVVCRVALAQLLEVQTSGEEAEAQWKELVRRNPSDGRFQVQLARFYERAKRPGEAEQTLTALVAAYPKTDDYRLQLAALLASRGEDARCAAVLEKTVADLPAQYPAYEQLARRALAQNKGLDAGRWLERALKEVDTPAERAAARLFLARVRQSEGRLDEALELTDRVLKDSPGNADARVLRGDLLLARQDFGGAVPEYRMALKEAPGDAQMLGALAKAHVLNQEPVLAEDVFKSALQRNPKLREARLGLASLFAHEQKFDQARAQLQKILENVPDDRLALTALGDLALAGNDPAGAVREFRRLRDLDPKSAPALYRSAVAASAEGNEREASSLLERALALNPDFEPALGALLDLRVKAKDLGGALAAARRQVEARPGNLRYRALLGKVLAQKGDADGARAVFEEVLAKDVNSLEAVWGLAGLERTADARSAAAARYAARFHREGKDSAAGLLWAVLLEMNGELAVCRAAYEEVLKARPDAVIAANNLANYLVENDPTPANLEKAEGLLAPLLPRYGRNPVLADTAAWLYYRKGNFLRARDLLLPVARAGGAGPLSNYHLGMIYGKLGDKAAAQKYLGLALKGKTSFPWRAEAEKALKGLG